MRGWLGFKDLTSGEWHRIDNLKIKFPDNAPEASAIFKWGKKYLSPKAREELFHHDPVPQGEIS